MGDFSFVCDSDERSDSDLTIGETTASALEVATVLIKFLRFMLRGKA
jgi:hypothetical protein